MSFQNDNVIPEQSRNVIGEGLGWRDVAIILQPYDPRHRFHEYSDIESV